MTEFSNKEIRWEEWEEDRLIKYPENSAYNGLLYKKYDEASLSVDSSSLVGLWIRTNDYGETDGYRFLSDGTVWRYYSDGDSLCMTWKESSEGNEIRITSGGGFNDYYNFLIIGDDLYLNSTRFTKVK